MVLSDWAILRIAFLGQDSKGVNDFSSLLHSPAEHNQEIELSAKHFSLIDLDVVHEGHMPSMRPKSSTALHEGIWNL